MAWIDPQQLTDDELEAEIKALEKAVAMSPGLVPAREELADLYGDLERHGQELDQLQVIGGLDRSHVARQVAIGMAQARAGHWDLAVLTLGGALELNPNEPAIFGALGRVWLERPREDRAFLSKARQALERVSSSPAATSEMLTLYGRALLRTTDYCTLITDYCPLGTSYFLLSTVYCLELACFHRVRH